MGGSVFFIYHMDYFMNKIILKSFVLYIEYYKEVIRNLYWRTFDMYDVDKRFRKNINNLLKL